MIPADKAVFHCGVDFEEGGALLVDAIESRVYVEAAGEPSKKSEHGN